MPTEIYDHKKLGRYLGVIWLHPDGTPLTEEELDNFYAE